MQRKPMTPGRHKHADKRHDGGFGVGPQVAATRKEFWPRREKGYETRVEKSRRENREQAMNRRRRQQAAEHRQRQASLDHMYSIGRWSNNEGSAVALEEFPNMSSALAPQEQGNDNALAGGSDSPKVASDAPFLADKEAAESPTDDYSEQSPPPVMGVRVELSPKKAGEDGRHSPIGFNDDEGGRLLVPETSPQAAYGRAMRVRPHTTMTSEPSTYAVNYFGVHRGEMGVLSHRRKMPVLSAANRPASKLSKRLNTAISHLTPFGQSLVAAAAASSIDMEDALPPNVKLDPIYQKRHIQGTARGGEAAAGRISPLMGMEDDERTVNSVISASR